MTKTSRPDITKQKSIRLCVWWPGGESGWYVKSECAFCGKAIQDRRNVDADEPLTACPDCQAIYYKSIQNRVAITGDDNV